MSSEARAVAPYAPHDDTKGATMSDAEPKEAPFAPGALDAFSARGSFCGVPTRRHDQVEEGQVVILGAPFDWGATHRPGARFGPKAIREADYLPPDGARPHLTAEVDPLGELRVVDAGDVPLKGAHIDESIAAIEEHVHAVAARGAIPVVLGGDHTITYPDATAVARHHGFGEVALVHFDAHADTGESQWGHLHGHATPMRRLIESGAVPGHRFVQIGLRGYWPPPETVAWMREQRMRCYFMDDILDRGLDAVVDEAVAYALDGGAKGVFVSVDIDVVDPAAAPGTGTPEPGGLDARELLRTVRRLGTDLDVLGADVVEVAPHYDQPMDITARLANRVVLELLTGMAVRRRAPAPPP
jgi:agmatinase